MRCQGRPDGKCPDNRNDNTVHNTIGDLFLCDACEEYRWPSITTTRRTAPAPAGKAPMKQVNTKSDTNKSAKAPVHASSSSSSALQQSDSTPSVNTTLSPQPDVYSTNPDSCPYCYELVESHHHGQTINCYCCGGTYHQHCTGLSPDVFAVLLSIVGDAGWVCRKCRNSISALRQLVTKNCEELSDMRVSIAYLHEELQCIKSNLNVTNPQPVHATTATMDHSQARDTSASTSASTGNNEQSGIGCTGNMATNDSERVQIEIHRAVHDIERRKQNVIITGLQESTANSVEECKKQDMESFVKLCEYYLPIKPTVSTCIRIGKKHDNRPRRLLVRLSSDSTVKNMLTSAKLLRNCDDDYIAQNVFINPDLSPTDAKLEFEKRQRRREARSRNNRNTVPRSLSNEHDGQQQEEDDEVTFPYRNQ